MSDTEDLAALNDRLMAKNHALAEALSRAGKELTKAKSQLAQLAQPPLTFATMVKVDSTRTDEDGIQHASAEVISGIRRMVVPVASNVNAARLAAGATVMLNEKLVLVEQRDADTVGQIRSVKQVLDDGRLIVTDASGNPVLIRRSGALAYAGINQGDRIIVDPSVRLAIEVLPAEGDKDLVLEETPDGLNLDEVRTHLENIPHVVAVHDLHASTVSTGMPMLMAHVVVEPGMSMDQAANVLSQLQDCLREHFPVSIPHTTFQLEPQGYRSPSAEQLHS